jgi:hypothetical protein
MRRMAVGCFGMGSEYHKHGNLWGKVIIIVFRGWINNGNGQREPLNCLWLMDDSLLCFPMCNNRECPI